MGKKRPAVPTPTTSAPSKKARTPVAAAEEPPAATTGKLQEASALLESLPASVLIVIAKSNSAATEEDDTVHDVWDVKPNSRERITTVRIDIQSRDSHYMPTCAEQTGKLLDGSSMTVESILHALEPKKPIEMFTVEALSILNRRLKVFSTALQRAGPIAGGSFTAAYDIWHAKRHHFVLQEFKPEELHKAVVEAALSRTKGPNPRGVFRSDQQQGQGKGRQRPRANFNAFNNFNRPRQSP